MSVLLFLLIESCTKRFKQEHPNIILIVIDTLRADHLSAYGYHRNTSPFLDDFAKNNILFKNAISTAPWTAASIASIFTSCYPTVHQVFSHSKKDKIKEASVLPSDFVTIAEHLKNNGYLTAAITANAWIDAYLGFAQGFDVFKCADFSTADLVNDLAYQVIDVFQLKKPKPFFLYLHYMDPHHPYKPPKEFDLYHTVPDSKLSDQQNHVQQVIDRYDGEIRYVDRKLSELMSFLKSNQLSNNSIIIITADHGEQFNERGVIGHGEHLHKEELHVPLMIQLNGEKKIISHMVSTLDILPTLLESLDISTNSSFQGVPFLPKIVRPMDRLIFSEATQEGSKKTITYRDQKLIIQFNAPEQATVNSTMEDDVRVYDTIGDPFELKPLLQPKIVSKLRKHFYLFYDDLLLHQKRKSALTTPLQNETIKQLKNLGYIQ